MFKITIPTNKGYTGVVAGVAFVNGEAKTDNSWKADWFLENGYEVEEIKEEEIEAEIEVEEIKEEDTPIEKPKKSKK